MEPFPFHPQLEFSTLAALIALIAGIWILVLPRALNYIVAIYLILIGGMGVWGMLQSHNISLHAIVALVAGILILIRPTLLNYIVAVYLIIIGILGLLRW